VKPSLWIPTTNLVDLAHLGKLGEELNECGAAVSRCIIQGIAESEPVTRKSNKEWLEDELADVLAMMELVVERFGLDSDRMDERINRKVKMKREWHQMITDYLKDQKG
jgi:NTP pyrophosphatase (non-canonical NTP hydrolase)